MKATELLTAFASAGKRTHLVGDLQTGVIIALDMEGRLFTVKDGEVMNRVNPKAIAGQSTQNEYLNPGGDGLWPAPEGTSLGYQYSTGAWRVAPGLGAVRYLVTEVNQKGTTIRGEVDLINGRGQGVPAIFKRQIKVDAAKDSVTVHVQESIIYIGSAALKNKDCLLAPWTLCQFDSGPGCEVVFPCAAVPNKSGAVKSSRTAASSKFTKSAVWDLYDEPSSDQRQWRKSLCHTATDGAMRYQIGIGKDTPWIEFHDPRRGLKVRRSAGALPEGQSYIDIRDAAPSELPSKKGVRYSVYSDKAGFMEIEAVGGCPKILLPGATLSIRVSTRFTLK